jgi:hypothetical protein
MLVQSLIDPVLGQSPVQYFTLTSRDLVRDLNYSNNNLNVGFTTENWSLLQTGTEV